MRGLADQRDTVFGELSDMLDRQRKQMASRFDIDTAENGMGSPFRGLRQLVIGQCNQPFGFAGCSNPHHAAAVAGQRHKYAWASRCMKLRGDISMRP